MKTIVKLSQVKGIAPLSPSTIYRLMKKGDFPKQIKLSERSSGWVLEEIEQWVEEKMNERKERI